MLKFFSISGKKKFKYFFKPTFSAPIIFWGYFLIMNFFFLLTSSYQKKVRAAGSVPLQNWSKLANQTSQNQCARSMTISTEESRTSNMGNYMILRVDSSLDNLLVNLMEIIKTFCTSHM